MTSLGCWTGLTTHDSSKLLNGKLVSGQSAGLVEGAVILAAESCSDRLSCSEKLTVVTSGSVSDMTRLVDGTDASKLSLSLSDLGPNNESNFWRDRLSQI